MSETDLLVVGAGPVGLTLACEAFRHGLRARIIDLRERASIHSKAQIVHARTLELLEDMGIADRFLERGIPIHTFKVFDEGAEKRLAQITIGGFDSHYQGVLSISQHETEVLLAERLEELGGTVERGVELQTFIQDDERVRATLTHADGREETFDVPWLVGCDGAHSKVRHVLELPFEGHPYPMGIMQSDARVDFPFPVHDDEVIAFISPKAIAGFFPLPGGENRYRFMIPMGAESDGEGDGEPTLEHFQEVLDEVAPPGSRVSDPKWMVRFRIHCRLTPTFRVGRAFIAGDAGHIHSPAGGQGMNMGMQDAYNLAWKLGLYARGRATVALLDSYSSERQRVAEQTLAWTDRATKGALFNFGIKNQIAVAARNGLVGLIGNLGFVQQRVARVMSMLDVAYSESVVCAQHRASLLGANVTMDTTSELPTVGSWMAFGGGPAPGHRAPDVHLDPTDPDSPRLFEWLAGTGYSLLLFDGAAQTDEGYRNLASIAEAVAKRFGERVKTHIVVPLPEAPDVLRIGGSLIFDERSAVHEAYGAETECLYLVRPDGYVGYRCQPASAQHLVAHLEGSLVPAG